MASNPVDEVKAQLNATLGKFSQNQAVQQKQIAELAQAVQAKNAPAPTPKTELDGQVFDEFSKSPADFASKLMYGSKEQAKAEIREEMASERGRFEAERANERFFDRVWAANKDVTGIFRTAVVERFNQIPEEQGTKSERINTAIKELRDQVAQEQATAIQLRDEEEAQKRMQSSPGGQAPWASVFGQTPSQNEHGKPIDPRSSTENWAKEQNALTASKRVGAGLRS